MASIKDIKADLEAYLNINVTTKAIKWQNTSTFTLNGVVQTTDQINALTIYIAPKIIPIQSPTDLLSSPTNGTNHQVFFQINIYTKKNTGTGQAYSLAKTLDGLFRNRIIDETTCEDVGFLGTFDSDDTEWMILPLRVLARTRG